MPDFRAFESNGLQLYRTMTRSGGSLPQYTHLPHRHPHQLILSKDAASTHHRSFGLCRHVHPRTERHDWCSCRVDLCQARRKHYRQSRQTGARRTSCYDRSIDSPSYALAGLPKQRRATDTGPKASVGKIIIPGGRFKRTGVAASRPVQHAGSEANEEWQRNGTGRLDVRGFRELKI